MEHEAKMTLRRAFGHALDDEALETLLQAAEKRSFAPDEIFVRQGEQGDALYVIVKGRVAVLQTLEDGHVLHLDTLHPGQYLGELALLDQAPRMASGQAITPLTVLRLDQRVFVELMREHPAVANMVLIHVLKNMRQQDQVIISELRRRNEELSRAYADLQAAQAELVEKERLEHELSLAAAVQRSLLPGVLPDIPPYRFAAFLRPARLVGGDFYDVIVLDDKHVGILLADVADKGLHAALIMAVARTLFRTEARRSLSPAEVALAVHKGLLDLERTQETFLTAFYGVLHRPSGAMTYIRAAHEKPLLVRPGQEIITLKGGDRFLGMLSDLDLTEYEVTLQDGDRLLVFSDGVPDATNRRAECYGYDRFAATAKENESLAARALVNGIVENIDSWTDHADAFDDLTLLAVAVNETGS